MAWDPVWEDIFCKQEWGKYPSEDLVRFVARNFYQVEERKNVKILEVGCGPGANLWYIAREGFAVYGIDGSAKAIERATNRLNDEVPQWTGELVVGDIGRLPFGEELFDAVIDNEAIYCNSYGDSQKIYEEMARVTKSGGKLFSRTFACGSWGDNSGVNVGHNAWIANQGPMAKKGYSRFTDFAEIYDLVKGFEISEVELLTRTTDNRKYEIREWIITGLKK